MLDDRQFRFLSQMYESRELFGKCSCAKWLFSTSISSMAESKSDSQPSSSKASSSNTPDVELDQLLSREASAFQREIEVERILKAFKLK